MSMYLDRDKVRGYINDMVAMRQMYKMSIETMEAIINQEFTPEEVKDVAHAKMKMYESIHSGVAEAIMKMDILAARLSDYAQVQPD